jgi:hypothetical protein
MRLMSDSLQHVLVVSVQHGGPGAVLLFGSVVVPPGHGQIIGAVPAEVAGGERDHVRDIGGFIEIIGPGALPVGFIQEEAVTGAGGCFQLVDLQRDAPCSAM